MSSKVPTSMSSLPFFVLITPLHTGCYRDPSWAWYRQPFPWWTMFFLVPLYSTCSSVGNLQSVRSAQLPIMVLFSCAAYGANRFANAFISTRGDIVAAFGAFVIGICGNTYSRVIGGTALDRKSTRLNSSHSGESRMPSSA